MGDGQHPEARGKTISQYRLLEKLGRGGMGVVYGAEDLTLSRHAELALIDSSTPEIVSGNCTAVVARQ
ncbi:MAG: hypothetical protein KGM47_02295 [Acidobacteriota bacterium]|nr:hypothetical protein [Acidobacteriota bacterium]